MHLEIITPDNNLFQGEVSSVIVPAVDGYLGILNNHAPLISTLKDGDVTITTDKNQQQNIAIKGGVVEVLNDKVIVLAD